MLEIKHLIVPLAYFAYLCSTPMDAYSYGPPCAMKNFTPEHAEFGPLALTEPVTKATQLGRNFYDFRVYKADPNNPRLKREAVEAYDSYNEYIVSITARSGHQIGGFAIQPRLVDTTTFKVTDQSMGYWQADDTWKETEAQYTEMNCPFEPSLSNTVSHRLPRKRESVNIRWKPAHNANQPVQFVVTIVEKYKIFYANLRPCTFLLGNYHPVDYNQNPNCDYYY